MVLAFSRLPDRVVYRVPPPWAWLMRVGQAIGLWLIADTNLRMGVGRFTGLSGALQFLAGADPQREAPAQGPRLEDDDGASTGGAFRLSRHPNNLGPTLIVCQQPTMGVRLLTFAVVGGLYSFFGSILEERRVRAERLREIIASRDPGDWIDGQIADIRAKAGGREAVG